jgi:class 3 adenylate cyclase
MEIEKSSDRNFDNILSVISYTGLSISSYAMDRNQTWPFVTIPSFVKKAESMLNLTGAFNVSMNVLVEENEKDAWEEYSVANQGWIQTGLELNEEGQVAPPIIPYIHKGNATLPAKGPADPYYSVRWQISPVPENIDWVNFNPLTNEMASTFDELMKMYPATLSALRDEPHDNEGRLQSHLIHPLFKQIYPSEVQSQRTLVGYLDTVVPLDIFFKNILPPGAAPLALVLHNSCGQTATFELRGPSVFLLSSTEDIHDKKFNHMEMLFIFSNQTLDRYGGISENMYSTAQSMDGIYCFYEYSIYPTQELQDIYMTYRPLYFTLGFVFTFLFAIILIFVYDFFRAKQKKSVKTKAERDNAILTSLFPVQVRQRLIDANDRSSNKKDMLKKEVRDDNQSDELSMSSKGTQKDERRIGDRSGRIDKFRSRLKRGNTRKSLNLSSTDFDPFDDDEEDEDAKVAKLLLSKPIADLFPRATVLFADICGFTSWSSKREPSDVFLLLETLYGEFDKAAKREGIFKVETIGDCYVAVTGLPEPRKDHAEATSRFALKCITKSKIIFNELIPKLGPDTANLNMRFGLHSGPVTAGVLRGEKSRFQLFGDT